MAHASTTIHHRRPPVIAEIVPDNVPVLNVNPAANTQIPWDALGSTFDPALLTVAGTTITVVSLGIRHVEFGWRLRMTSTNTRTNPRFDLRRNGQVLGQNQNHYGRVTEGHATTGGPIIAIDTNPIPGTVYDVNSIQEASVGAVNLDDLLLWVKVVF